MRVRAIVILFTDAEPKGLPWINFDFNSSSLFGEMRTALSALYLMLRVRRYGQARLPGRGTVHAVVRYTL